MMMTDLEERLRRDLRQISERARPESIRPLRAPAPRRKSRTVRWLAPVAAMGAVIGIIAGLSLTAASPARRPPASLPGAAPRYYVTVLQTNDPGLPITAAAVVHDSATGAVLARVRLPLKGFEFPSITAASNDRTFVIAEQPSNSRSTFYLLQVAADGRSASLSRLPISVPGYLFLNSENGVALSPDGTRLAMDVAHCIKKTCPYSGVRVVDIATGAARSWYTQAIGTPVNVSWAGNGQVAFEWQSGRRIPPPAHYRLLNVTGPGGNLLAASRPVGAPPAEPTGYVPMALVTRDGRMVITSTVRGTPDGHGRNTVKSEIVELSARTGKLVRVLYSKTEYGIALGNPRIAQQVDLDCLVLSLAPRGIHLLVSCPGLGRLDGSRFTPLPGFPSEPGVGTILLPVTW